jgi:hypothetical protein
MTARIAASTPAEEKHSVDDGAPDGPSSGKHASKKPFGLCSWW